jgi:hypothetical protein
MLQKAAVFPQPEPSVPFWHTNVKLLTYLVETTDAYGFTGINIISCVVDLNGVRPQD